MYWEMRIIFINETEEILKLLMGAYPVGCKQIVNTICFARMVL